MPYSMSTTISTQVFNSLQILYDPPTAWSAMYSPIFRLDHAKILSVETKYVKEKYSFNSIFQIRIYLYSSKPSFTLGAVNPAGLLRPLHNQPRSNQLGEFVHASTYLCRSHFKTLQTMSQWCWWLEISRGILFLSCRDGYGQPASLAPPGILFPVMWKVHIC